MAILFNSWLLDATSILVTGFVILYFYITRNFNYWEKRGVRSVRPKPFLGSISSILLLRESIGCWLARNYRETVGEKFFGAYFVDKPALVVRDLELVKNIFVKDAHAFLDRNFSAREDVDPLFTKNLFGLKGKKWRHLRVKLSPTFTSGRMKKMFYLVDECGKQLASCLQQSASSGKPVNVKETMARYSTDVISSCAFGVNTNAQVDPQCEFRAVLKRVFERESLFDKIASIMVFILPFFLRLFRLKVIAYDIEDLVRKMFWDVVEQRRKTGESRNDFMDLMLKIIDEGEVRSEDANDQEEINKDNSYSLTGFSKAESTDFEMKNDDFVAQAFVFLLAGFETSSSVLNYALYELALNPDVQEKLRTEVTSTLAASGGKMTYETVVGMTYLEMVVSETLRKYPTLSFLERMCLSDYKIPGTKLTIEKGIQVMIPVLGIHSDPEYYPDPTKFDPERFSAENKSKIPPYAFLPFGEGPRICIGMRFGQMQVKTALIHVLRSFRVRACAVTPEPPLTYQPHALTHTPRENIVLTFTKVD
ncbi:cytochrome P450 6j1-like [Bacillus rossius redtenbacheri]|uniref:cytochrome P450 6j1-like n=1 Tax=Bacillus rossius redtenbacheri TaxID=93214 RepID=UPI002FDD9AD7